jgi:hypothetical protein
MREDQLIRELNRLFGKDRKALREALLAIDPGFKTYKAIGRQIRRQTGQPVLMADELLIEIPDDLSEDKCDMFWLGDISYYYEIVLNREIKRGMDFDKKLALHCGGPVYICVVWISLLFPIYAIDTYSMAYLSNPPQWEFTPHYLKLKAEKISIYRIRQILRDNGFSRASKKFSAQKVRKAITDCRVQGEATVFDCLFSDTQQFHEDIVRFPDESLPGTYPGTEISWLERYNQRGQLIEKYVYQSFSSGDSIRTYLNGKTRIKEVIVHRSTGKGKLGIEMAFDVEKKLQKVRKARLLKKR